MLVSKSDFSRAVGVTPVAITKAIKGGALAGAVSGDGRIDVRHPDAVAYASKHKILQGVPLGEMDDAQSYDDVTSYLEKFGDLTVSELLEHHGTDLAVERFVKAAQIAYRAYKIQLDISAQEGRLINVELCKTMFIDPVFRSYKQLLSDGAVRISREVISMVKAGEDEADIRRAVENSIGSFIRPAKDKMLKNLEEVNALEGFDDVDD